MRYVILSKDLDPLSHKKPVMKDWQRVELKREDIIHAINVGHGVGVVVDGFGVLDLDGNNEHVMGIVNEFIGAGCLVIRTFRGWHIFMPRQGVGDIKGEVGGVRFEYYEGLTTRQVVIPIVKTPRWKLLSKLYNSGIIYFKAKEISLDIFNLDLFEIILNEVKGYGERYDIILRFKMDNDFHNVDNSKLTKYFGIRWRRISLEGLVERIRGARVGERHNVLFYASLLAEVRGFDYVSVFNEAAKEVYKDEYNDKEVILISKWLKEHNDIVESLKGLINKNVETVKVSKKNIDVLYNEIFADDRMQVYFDNNLGKYYFLHNGYAIHEDKFKVYVSSLGKIISDNLVESLKNYILSNYDRVEDVVVLGNYVKVINGMLVIAGIMGKREGILIKGSNEDKIRFYNRGELENFYILFGISLRDFGDINIEDEIEIVNDFVKVINHLIGEDNKVMSALLSNIICGTARGLIIVNGPSGSGKSTFSIIMQMIANGRFGFLSTKDERNLISALANNRIVGIDENISLNGDLQNIIKSLISYGNITQRALFTNFDNISIKTDASIILSSVEVNNLHEDLLRRGIVINLQRRRHIIAEDDMVKWINKYANYLLIGAMYIAKVNNMDSKGLFSIFDGRGYDLPSFLARVTKRDIASVLYLSSLYLTISIDELRDKWEKMRGGVREMALKVWDEIIYEYESNLDFRNKIEEGLTASEIADFIAKTEEEKKYLKKSIAKTGLRVSALIEELGYEFEVNKVKRNRNFIALYKIRRNKN